ncbi:hypothetical protein HYU96_01270 [Candidatus Daviesbacteria bacterium]|nr:hypothetical protein [Candidatus Daviesbacteria bacterium]
MVKLTRRGLIQGFAIGAAGVAAAPYGLPPAQHETWAWNTGKETFHFIGYTQDALQEHLLKPPDPEKEFAKTVDGIFMEDVSNYLNPAVDTLYQAIAESKADHTEFLWMPIYKYCREKTIPLYLGDTAFKADSEILQKIANLTTETETFAGSLAAARITRPKTLGRRRFLGATAALGVAIWGSAPSALYLLNKEGGKHNLQDADVQTRRDIETTLSDKAHPEKPTVLARNALWAKKLLFLGKEMRQRGIRHPQVGIVAGFNHRYLDFFLRNPKEIDGVLSMYKDLLTASVVSREYLYKILELNFREGSFGKQILRVPELESAFKEREATPLEAKG